MDIDTLTENSNLDWFDWEVISECTYPVPTAGLSAEVETDCGEPALYKMLWGNHGNEVVQSMNVCQEHFELVKEQEGNLTKSEVPND